MWLIVPVIQSVTDGYWILFVREMGHNLYSASKYRPVARTHLQRQSCRGWKPLWKPCFGLTVDLLSVAFCSISSTDEKRWPFNFIYWGCAHIRCFCPYRPTPGNITSCLFQGAVRKRIHTKSTPSPSPVTLESQGNFLHPSLVSVIHPLTELLCLPSAT